MCLDLFYLNKMLKFVIIKIVTNCEAERQRFDGTILETGRKKRAVTEVPLKSRIW